MTTEQPTATRCTRCGRTLCSDLSRAAGMGRTCARRAAVETTYSAAQLAKAVELIEDGGIAVTPLRTARGRRVFEVVASSGAARYMATVTACTCPAGLKGRRCYHRAALRLAS